jgi:hypothetical protein
MAFVPDSATLIAVLNSDAHSASDVNRLVRAFDGIVSAAIWGQLAAPREEETTDITKARTILRAFTRSGKARERFYPRFSNQRFGTDLMGDEAIDNFSPADPLDTGVRYGLDAFLENAILHRDRRLYERLYGVAQITRTAHNSPLILEMTVGLGIGLGLTAALILGVAHAAVGLRIRLANARRHEAEATIREIEVNQKQIQTYILTDIADALEGTNLASMPKETLLAAASFATTPVVDLSRNPTIGQLSVGLSMNAGELQQSKRRRNQ